MKYIYVAGPYSAATPEEIERNVWRAIDAGDEILKMGLWPMVPHEHHYWHARHKHDYKDWTELDLAWIRRCDGVYRMHGASPGADREVELARFLGIPIFTTMASLRALADGVRKIREATKAWGLE
ncbi:MAG TPA: DUF4406 domain-containing protein [Spirochaetia bacterium]|nr:DUF4406 domain-containing protein [Spirochaetia bacterium]